MTTSTTKTQSVIRDLMQMHRDAIEQIKEATAPQRVERDALLLQREQIDAQINALTTAIRSRDTEIAINKKGIAACALALGSKRLGGGFTE